MNMVFLVTLFTLTDPIMSIVLQVILFVYSLTVHISVSSPLESVVRIVII